MIWKRYQHELIVLAALLLMIIAYFYKSSSANRLGSVKMEVSQSVMEVGEIIALKKQWGASDLTKRVEKVKKGIAPEKIKKFTVKSKKLTASFKGLSDKEMNLIMTKLENIAVQISKINVKRQNGGYTMEFTCKW
ncbi:MAG: hypothetical protein U9Q90_00075 [Campylobacterota bacterium]|nr:hypothetical protein [Campylobacterota bacterium]